jgi:1,4-alpha-glucan branching enzyme
LAGPRDGGWWDIDLRALHLADGAYEYEFVVERGSTHRVVADPYAEELTDRGAVRPVLHMHHGERVRPAFSWEGELSGTGLPNDNELAICELPMRRAQTGDRRASLDEALDRTMDRRLEETIAASQVNCIQMLPIQDSPDARNGGYGTRFFFAPDRSIGTPLLVRSFIKKCHQRGLRVIMDLVMNHARECPLRDLAFDWFFLRDGSEEPDSKGNPRPAWGGDILRYRTPRGGVFHARNLQYDVASFFITEYHVDGFRLDEFKGIDNYEFIQTFTERAHAVHHRLFGGSRPFLVIAEDSGRRAQVATRAGYRGKPVVDAIWDFNFRDEVRQLVSDSMPNGRGEPPRRDRVKRLLTAGRPDLFAEHEREHRFFPDMANRVTYCTSHDAPPDEDLRLLPYYTGRLRREGLPESFAQEMVRSTFALTLSAAGIPMFLAGEELGEARKQIRELIRMRTGNPALHRNEVEFFGFSSGTANAGFHPAFDAPDGDRLFAFCRTGGKPLGSAGQVVVVANCGRRDYCSVEIDWPWDGRLGLVEVGGNGSEIPVIEDCRARLSLRPYEVRVFVSQPACPDDGH